MEDGSWRCRCALRFAIWPRIRFGDGSGFGFQLWTALGIFFGCRNWCSQGGWRKLENAVIVGLVL